MYLVLEYIGDDTWWMKPEKFDSFLSAENYIRENLEYRSKVVKEVNRREEVKEIEED